MRECNSAFKSALWKFEINGEECRIILTVEASEEIAGAGKNRSGFCYETRRND